MKSTRDLKLRERVRYAMQSKPKVGDAVWWHGRELRVTRVDKKHMRAVFENELYEVTASLRELVFDPKLNAWKLPGTEGPMPKVVHGERVLPTPPSCPLCGRHTLRVAPCFECKEHRPKAVAEYYRKQREE